MSEAPYYIIEPKVKKVPFVLSVPHCGIQFPDELKSHYNPKLIQQPDDTDWFVERLYNFATDLGITVIYAKYSRWVIDLNRSPESTPLYNDGRIITSLTPTTDFFGNNLYIDKQFEPNEKEVNRRIEKYYQPYYDKITQLLTDLQKEHKNVLLWDAHSIRTFVPTIRKEKFPDLILGDNDEQTADAQLIEIAHQGLKQSDYQVNHNTPFKGGYITRYFGNPNKNIHALQLEMVKSLYMQADELTFDEQKAERVRKILKPIFQQLINQLEKL